MIDGREDPHQTIVHGLDANPIGSPHLVGGIGCDPSVVEICLAPRPAMRRKQMVFAHQT
jgi:hypothetical protein